MDVVAGLQECLGSMLASFERSVGFAEGVVMSFDPDVLLPNAFAATVPRSLDDRPDDRAGQLPGRRGLGVVGWKGVLD
jgi:hypothetical protein